MSVDVAAPLLSPTAQPSSSQAQSHNGTHANEHNGTNGSGNAGHSSSSSSAIVEPSYSPQHQQQLNDMRAAITQHLTTHGPTYCDGFKPPITEHWRDLYHRYRHLTAITPTPDPRLSPSYTPASLAPTWPDYQLYRFLKARRHNVKDAVAMFLNATAFRVQFGADDLVAQPVCPFADYKNLILSERLHHTDSEGRPVFLNWLGAVRTAELAAQYPPELSYMLEVWGMEEALRAQQHSSERLGRRVTLLTVVLQGGGLSLAHRGMVSGFLGPVLFVDDTIFPENMHQLIVINAPSVFKVLWAVAAPLIDAQTRKKFAILGAHYHDELERRVGVKELPRELGGQCELCKEQGACLPVLDDWETGMRRIGKGTEQEAAQLEAAAAAAAGPGLVVDIGPRTTRDVSVPISRGDSGGGKVTLWWSFTIDSGRDIDFSMSFRAAGATSSPHPQPTYTLLAPHRFEARTDGAAHRGCWHFTVSETVDEGTAILQFSNAMSTFSHKKLTIAHGLSRTAG